MHTATVKSGIRNPESENIPPFRKRLKNGVIYYGICGLLALVNGLPRRIALDLCGILGFCVYICATGTRRRTVANLQRAFGHECALPVIKRMAGRVFWDLGRNAVDVMRLSRITPDNVDALVRVQGLEHLDAAYDRGQGVIAISGHIGNFELLGVYLALKGYRVTVVAAALYDSRLDTLLSRNRGRGGLQVVHRDRATSAVLRALRRGDIVGLLVDQDTRVPGTFVEFFGQQTYTPIGPAVIASRTGAPVVPMVIHRQTDDTHLITIRPPFALPCSEQSDERIREAVQQYTTTIETFIRQAPTQWVWMHDRWKTQPSSA